MKKFVWDSSAVLNIKEENRNGYSPGYSLIRDLTQGVIDGPYLNIFPAILFFEVDAAVSRKWESGEMILRTFYIIDENSIIYPVDHELIKKSVDLVEKEGFSSLRGADLVFACIAYLENAWLVTLDNHFQAVSEDVRILNLNDSRYEANYRKMF